MATLECVLMISFILLAIDGQFLSKVAIAPAGCCSCVNDIHSHTDAI